MAALAAGCGGGGGPGAAEHWPMDGGVDGMAGQGGTQTLCTPSPRTSEDLTPRIDLVRQAGMATAGGPRRLVMKTSELFQRFNTTCGRCHVASANGGFQVSEATFATVFDQTRMLRLESNDPGFAMPPEGKAFNTRAANDPIVQLARLLEQWLAQDRPGDMFFVEDAASAPAAGDGFYAYTTLTNMGDCVPAKQMYASSISGEMDAKDAFFADATGLPANLADTDLTTFDTAALAANGVIAFRPTYALWSAGSRKLRFIRVPKGTSVAFHKDTQTFDVPPNTRFYKTFLRKVVDSAGRTSYRKMETRLIVTRPDTLDIDGKTPKPNALFGTYVWSDDEMTARLLDAPYQDGSPFADRTIEYVTNEIEYQDVIDSLPAGAASLEDKLNLALKDPKYLDLVQHYAVPGSIRCVQCHRGSPSRDFLLGFQPLQIAQRAAGTGGTYDPADADELDQLQRFIDYGLITGMTSPADVVKLEESQLPRKPRTDGELQAQAYMLGNCAHCHNPRGYPSLVKPELLTALNFLPGPAIDNGIFEMSLENKSPLRQRGANQDIPMPYITPSLRDYPVADTSMVRIDNGAIIESALDSSGAKHEVTWTPKYMRDTEDPAHTLGCRKVPGSNDTFRRAYCGDRTTGHTFVAAPWRSLIYRNTDTPFPYFDDYVPFPHMPMNTAGFDCRVPRIMGNWMVGLPARIKEEYRNLSEDVLPHAKLPDGTYFRDYIDAPQPYEEVKPGDEGYAEAQMAAQARLAEYHAGVRYNYCPDVLSADIMDPIRDAGQPLGGERKAHTFFPIPSMYLNGGIPPIDPAHPGQYVQPAIGVPYHAEWFNYDPTDSPPPWQPRRGPEWKDIVVDGKPDISLPAGKSSLDDNTATSRRRLVEALHTATLTDDLRQYALKEVPYGLWLPKPECASKLTAANHIAKVSDIAAADRPVWMTAAGSKLSPDAPVYMAAPGFTLYRHICFNCHGPRADGKGLQGDALAASSEGQTRPANLSGGLLGPPDMLGGNLLRVFGLGTDDPKTADLWGARFVGWMTLGGTLQLIPQDVVNQVQATKVLDAARPHLDKLGGEAAGVSANMLNLAKGLCAEVLPDQSALENLAAPTFGFIPIDTYALLKSNDAAFIRSNYDWEMWMNLCSRFNRPVVRVYGLRKDSDGELESYLKALYYGDGDGKGNFAYPADQPIWDQDMKSRTGLDSGNYYSSCFQAPGTAIAGEGPSDANPDKYAAFRARFVMPACPASFLGHGEALMWSELQQTPEQVDAVKEWTLRGAINAAMSVFSYLKQADLGHKDLPLYFNECQTLP